jgi:hypothetical protein
VSPSVLFRRRTGVQGLERPELVIGPDRTRAASTIICLKAGGFRLDPDRRALSVAVERWNAHA